MTATRSSARTVEKFHRIALGDTHDSETDITIEEVTVGLGSPAFRRVRVRGVGDGDGWRRVDLSDRRVKGSANVDGRLAREGSTSVRPDLAFVSRRRRREDSVGAR